MGLLFFLFFFFLFSFIRLSFRLLGFLSFLLFFSFFSSLSLFVSTYFFPSLSFRILFLLIFVSCMHFLIIFQPDSALRYWVRVRVMRSVSLGVRRHSCVGGGRAGVGRWRGRWGGGGPGRGWGEGGGGAEGGRTSEGTER